MRVSVMQAHGGFQNSITIEPQPGRKIWIQFDHYNAYPDTKQIDFATAAGGLNASIADDEWYDEILDEMEAAGL